MRMPLVKRSAPPGAGLGESCVARLLVLAAAFAAVTLAGPAALAAGGDRILRVSDGKVLDAEGLAADLAGTRVVFFGELHDQPLHHRAQLALVKALAETRPVAVGLEMFQAASQGDLDRWTAGEGDPGGFLPVYYRNWNFPWAQYRDIFLYARERRIPMVGLNVPDDITAQVARRGYDSLTEEQKGRIPAVSCKVDEEYEEFIRQAVGDESHGTASFRFFCEAQMVWDTAMAHYIDGFLRRDERRTLVVLAGSGHSWKPGIPARLAALNAAPRAVVLPEIPGNLEADSVTAKEADYLWLGITEVEER